MAERDFMFGQSAVGTFDDSALPRSLGRHQYEPYRGAGHYEMQEQLQAGHSPRCHYDADDIRVSFTVRSCPEYGVLELCDFDTTPLNAA